LTPIKAATPRSFPFVTMREMRSLRWTERGMWVLKKI